MKSVKIEGFGTTFAGLWGVFVVIRRGCEGFGSVKK